MVQKISKTTRGRERERARERKGERESYSEETTSRSYCKLLHRKQEKYNGSLNTETEQVFKKIIQKYYFDNNSSLKITFFAFLLGIKRKRDQIVFIKRVIFKQN